MFILLNVKYWLLDKTYLKLFCLEDGIPTSYNNSLSQKFIIQSPYLAEYDVWPKRGKSDTGRGGGRGFGGRGVGGRGFGGRGFGGRGFGGRGFGGRDGPRGRGMRGRGGARGGARGGRGGSGIPAEATRPGYQPKINPHKPRLLPSSFTLKTDYPEEGGADVPSGESSDPNAENQ